MTTLPRGALTWYKNLNRISIDSWDKLCHEFIAKFSTSKTQLKMIVSLEAIVQGKNEPLLDYIECFNKEVVHVRGTDERMKKHLIEKGLRPKTNIKKAVQLDQPITINEFLRISKFYIRYKGKMYTNNLNKERKEVHQHKSSENPFYEKNKEVKPSREGKRPIVYFDKYTPFEVSSEEISVKITSVDLKEAGIKYPKPFTQKL